MTKYTEKEVRYMAYECGKVFGTDWSITQMLTAYADLLAAQPVAVPDGRRDDLAIVLGNIYQDAEDISAVPIKLRRAVDRLRAMLAAAPSPAAEGAKVAEPEWISWQGGSCPVDDFTYVEIKMRDGDIATYLGRLVGWSVTTRGSDVVAYRIVPTPDFSGSRPSPQPADVLSDEQAECNCPTIMRPADAKLGPCPIHDKRAVLAQPSGGDERAAFEEKFQARGYPVARLEIDEDSYLDKYTQAVWAGWQARAALAQQHGRDAERWREARRTGVATWNGIGDKRRLCVKYNERADEAIDAAIAASTKGGE